MKTYNYQDVQRGELTGFFGFALALLFALLVTWVAGCGDVPPPPSADGCPRIEISCDAPVEAPRCFVLVWDADTVEAFYDGEGPVWWDYDITDDRASYLDSPRGSVFAVEACNEHGCAVEVEVLR